MSSRRKWLWLILLACLPVKSDAWTHGSAGATGSALLNIGSSDLQAANFINVLKPAVLTFNTASDAGKVDDDGYLTSSPTGNVNISFPSGPMWTNVQYKLRWDAGVQFSDLHFNSTMSSCSAVSATVTGCSGSGSTDITTTGGAGSVTFTTSATQFSMFFVAAGTYSHSSGALSLYRLSDETDFLAGELYTPEYKTVLRSLNPKTIRPMQWVQQGPFNGETTWNYRTKPTTMTWGGNRYPPGAWAGTITGTDQYTSPAAPDTPLSGWVSGEVIVGSVSNASSTPITVSGAANNGSGLCRLTLSPGSAGIITNQSVWVANVQNSDGSINTACSNAVFTATLIDGTHIDLQGTTFAGSYKSGTGFVGVQTLTVTGKTGGAKFIGFNGGLPLLAGATITTGIGTFVYDSILDKVLYQPGGINSSVPIEAQATLANNINANLWAVVPPWASDSYVTNWAATVCGNLKGPLYLYAEYTNEDWNPGFPQWQWSLQRGLALGWVASSNQAPYGWYSLRVRQIMGNLIPSNCSHARRRVMAYQAAGDSTVLTNQFEGTQLTPGNANYNAYTGSANYSAAPNRPIDVSDVIAYAPYTAGTNLCTGPDLNCTPTAANAPFYQSLVTAWEGGQSATAISSIDNDIRLGTTSAQTVTASGTTFTTPLAHGFTANSTDIMFTVSGGTAYSNIAINTIYRVSGTSNTSCPGGVVCNFTVQSYVGGFPSGSNVNAGSAGSGTVTVGVVSAQSMAKVASNWYQFGETNAATFDATRNGLPPLRVEWYEGNLEPQGLSSAQCTALSISGSNCTGSIAAAITAWKNDTSSKLTQTAYYNQFMGTDAAMPPTFGLMPHSKTPAQLVLENSCGGGSAYALLSDCFPNSTPYQTYNGFAAFHGVP